jgi:hypothetical protein
MNRGHTTNMCGNANSLISTRKRVASKTYHAIATQVQLGSGKIDFFIIYCFTSR